MANIFNRYKTAGNPDLHNRPLSAKSAAKETSRLKKLREYFDALTLRDLTRKNLFADYAAHRRKTIRGGDGGRAIELELSTLRRALRWAAANGVCDHDPLAALPRARFAKPPDKIAHCRDFAPVDADELHHHAALLFENPQSESLGWQLLFTAMIGGRCSEMIALRKDATQRGQPGFVEPIAAKPPPYAPEGTRAILWLHRAKRGVNPWAYVHPLLTDCLAAHDAWHKKRFPFSPWYFPSAFDGGKKSVDVQSLTHALARLGPLVAKAHRTAHGVRSFYVTVRRSMGVPDSIIALEIGHRTGGALMVTTYGDNAPIQLDWIPRTVPLAWARWQSKARKPAHKPSRKATPARAV